MAQTTCNVAQYLLIRLKQLNVTELFQIPGDYVKYFTTELEVFPGIETIGTTNELDAAYAADAYGRTRGMAAVSLQYGVSTFSALNAVAGAYVERSPMIVISATPSASDREITDKYGVLYHHSTGNLKADQEVFEHVTVAADTIKSAKTAPQQIDALIVAALTHQRPVYVACYENVWKESCDPPSTAPLQAEMPVSDIGSLNNAVDMAWERIQSADNPMIFAGVEILRHGLSDLLQELIEASGFLYTTTSLGKTVLDEGGDKFIGTYADVASISQVPPLVTDADYFLTLGAIITDDYLTFIKNNYDNMVLATAEETRVDATKYDGVGLKDFMEALLQKFQIDDKYPIDACAPSQPVYPEPWISNLDEKYSDDSNVLTYNRFFQHAMKFLKDTNLLDDIIMTYGVSSSMYVATNAYGLKQNSFISSAAWQCIGFETGATSGAQLGSGKRAWTIAGDGGFMMICQAVSTLAKYNLDAVIFVMNNGVYAIEQVFVNVDAFEQGPEYKFDEFDILGKWDYMALAKAYGADGHRVVDVNGLQDVLRKISVRAPKELRKPILVELVIPKKNLPGQMGRFADS